MKKQEWRKSRETGFDLSFRNDRLPRYNALHDHHLRHFFENKYVQTHLYETGLIDGNGRVINLDKNKSKLFIIEQEFKAAEKQEEWRRTEEEEMRYRVQKKRFETLEKARHAERLAKLKEDRKLRQQIMNASRSALNLPMAPPTKKGKSRGLKKKKKKKSGKKNAKASSPSVSLNQDSQATAGSSFFQGKSIDNFTDDDDNEYEEEEEE